MTFWETVPAGSDQPAEMRDFAEIWRAAEKIVFSRTLLEPSSERTRIEAAFEPAAIGRLKDSSALPDGVRVQLELLAERSFASGVVYLRYALSGVSGPL